MTDSPAFQLGDVIVCNDQRVAGDPSTIREVRWQCVAVAGDPMSRWPRGYHDHDGIAYVFQNSPGIHRVFDGDVKFDRIVPEDEMTTHERVRVVLLRGVNEFGCSNVADEHYEEALLRALVGPARWDACESANALDSDLAWERAADLIDFGSADPGAHFQMTAAAWHTGRQPESHPSLLITKAVEELGEVGKALHGRGDMPAEAGDVIVALAILIGRWFPDRNVFDEARRKLAELQDSTHPYAAGDWQH